MKNKFTINYYCGLFVLLFLSISHLSGQTTQTFTFTGGMQTFTVPSCVSTISVDLRGASGASNTAAIVDPGGLGGRVTAVYPVTAGQVLNIFVGGRPYNGGGTLTGNGGVGGGASDIRIGGTALSNRVLVAGGGGGGGDNCGQTAEPGGGGGGLVGETGWQCGVQTQYVGTGGSQTAGGLCLSTLNPGTNGALGIGGNGGIGSSVGAGGGGGYYGGGGASYGSAGGGSSYTDPSATSVVHSQGFHAGTGVVVLSYNFDGGVVSVTATSTLLCSGATSTLTGSNNVLSYTWSPGGSNSQTIAVSPTSNTAYTVQSTNSIGCISSFILPVTVNASPTISIASTTLSACLGQTVGLTASGVNTYTWAGGNGNNAVLTLTPSATTAYTVNGTNACGTTSAAVTVTVNPLPVFVSASSTLVCSAAATTLTPGGATAYTWMPGNSTQTTYIINPVANTIYTVSGRTGNCIGSNTINISTKPNPTVTIVATATSVCDGDVASLTANGGLSYTWTPIVSSNTTIAVSPTVSTLYSVTGINNVNCTASAVQVVVVKAKPVINIAASETLICPGGVATLSATGTSTAYAWSNSANTATTRVQPMIATIYTVTGTNSLNCTNSSTVAISVFDPTIAVSSSTVVCRGTNVNLSASGMDSYHWSTGSGFSSISVTPTTTTTYTVGGSSTQNNVTCLDTGVVVITVNPNPTITASGSPSVICRGGNAVITASGAVTYAWLPDGATTAITVTPTADQTYTVTGTDANGCKGTSSILLRVVGCVGIEAHALNAVNLLVYPNPNNGDFTIGADQAIDLQITNELGQQVRTISLNSNSKEAKISNLASGIYFITGKNENGSVKQKIVITR